jgi:hypothetical protein
MHSLNETADSLDALETRLAARIADMATDATSRGVPRQVVVNALFAGSVAYLVRHMPPAEAAVGLRRMADQLDASADSADALGDAAPGLQ